MELYVVTSNCLGKKWVLLADSVEDATGKVIRHSGDTLKNIIAESPGDVDLDIRVNLIDEGITEV